MEFKGTQGQWYVNGDKYPSIESRHTDLVTINTYPTIATVNSVFRKKEESKANALLISKAPELLEMLQSIVSDFEGDYVTELTKEQWYELVEILHSPVYPIWEYSMRGGMLFNGKTLIHFDPKEIKNKLTAPEFIRRAENTFKN